LLGIALADRIHWIWGDGKTGRICVCVYALLDVAVPAGKEKVYGIYNAGSGTGYSLSRLCSLEPGSTGMALSA